jgi:DNA-damage-inducible protein J
VLQCGYNEVEVAKESIVRARIDEQTKAEAEAVLGEIGLTVSAAVRLMLVRVAKEKALPFNPLVPNADTVAAMRELENGGGETATSVGDLMADLRADD